MSPLPDSPLPRPERDSPFQAVSNLFPALLWGHDPEGRALWFNQRWREYTGQTSEQAGESGWLEAVHPDDREHARALFLQAVQTGQQLRLEHRLRRKDGAYRWFLVQLRPVVDESNAIVQWFGAGIDIHHQRLTLEKQGRELRRSHRELQKLACRLLNAHSDESRRIARDLHDDTVQKLALLEMEIERLRLHPPRSAAGWDERLEHLRRNIASLSDELRSISHRLHPSTVEHLGLDHALRGLVEEFAAHWPHPVDYISQRVPPEIPLTTAAELYRIAQEALRNVAKHAPNAAVAVVLRGTPAALSLRIDDTGPGFERRQTRGLTGLGLVSMQERARLIGATLRISTKPGEGTSILLRVPCRTHPSI